MTYGIGEASGKVILMGEHAVVYGAPAIAMPFFSVGVKCTVRAYEGPTYIQSICYDGLLRTSPDDISGIKKLIEVTLEHLNQANQNLKIIIESMIPPQRGLGSSAAVSVAIVRGLYDAFEEKLTFEDLNHLVSIAESIHHSNPSGLDAATILNEQMMVFEKGKGIRNIKSTLEGFMIVGDSGVEGNTKEAVNEVQQKLKENPKLIHKEIENISQLTLKAEKAIDNNQIHTLGYAMTQAHMALRNMGVSNDLMDHYVSVALKKGAYGAKITGGGKGGCMIAICDSIVDAQKIANGLKREGIKETWIYNMKEVYSHD